MTTVDVETYADTGGLAGPDLNIKVLLRHKVVPAFLDDVRYVGWRRKTTSLTMTINVTGYDLPTDFWQMSQVNIDPNLGKGDELIYIGEEPENVMAAQAATVKQKPGGYYFSVSSTNLIYRKINFDAPPDQAYVARYTYYNGVNFADDATSVDFATLIPYQYQWALVEGLKREIYTHRYGVADNRFQLADAEYKAIVLRAVESPELARRRRVVNVR